MLQQRWEWLYGVRSLSSRLRLKGWTLALALSSAMSLLSCGGLAQAPRQIPDVPPSLCEQITDYVDAYIGYVSCRQPELGGVGYFATVAELQANGLECSEANGVVRLPYRSELVDSATYSVMQEELQGDLGLYNAIQAISFASLSTIPTGTEQNEAARRRTEKELRQNFREVPFLYQQLVSKIAEQLGAEETCQLKLPTPIISVNTLPSILERLANVEEREDGCVKRGLMNFPAGEHIDPNVAVAIVRLQRGNMVYVPTLSQLEAMLRSMGVTLEETQIAMRSISSSVISFPVRS